MAKKPVLLCIMDGFGWVPNETFGNAVVAAKTGAGLKTFPILIGRSRRILA